MAMQTGGLASERAFHWEPQPRAQAVVDELVASFLAACPPARELAERMRTQTGTRFRDWIDFIEAPEAGGLRGRLEGAGFTARSQPGAMNRLVHEGGLFPALLLGGGPGMRVGIKVERVEDFLAAQGVSGRAEIEGEPLSRFRWARAFASPGTELWAVERHGYQGFAPTNDDARVRLASLRHFDRLCRRERAFDRDEDGFAHLHRLLDDAITDLGTDWACDVFFAAERDYWMRRNKAGRFQKFRQDGLGLGWANHDHHTYRCGRATYTRVIATLEKVGLRCRERFYAGEEAGWGAQVLEHPVTGITVFADVDLGPEEIAGDFAHQPLPWRGGVGTIGLWVRLHGESMLQAGMHHLEAQFDWHALKEQLEKEGGVKTMDPFTTLPYLRQAFTEAEMWPVEERRLAGLVADGSITAAQAENFRRHGAMGSHLENLQREDGFKGFNQKGVSDIIARTNPAKAHAPVAAGA